MKPNQNVCLGVISDDLENGSCRIKKWVTKSNLRKTSVRSRGHIFSPIIMKSKQNICLDKIMDGFENGPCRVKK